MASASGDFAEVRFLGRNFSKSTIIERGDKYEQKQQYYGG